MSIYLDWAATTPPDKDVFTAFQNASLTEWANPSSQHTAGKQAAAVLLEARKRCAEALGVNSGNIIFTSGGTESDYLPLLSLLARPVRGSIAVSAIEHPAILEQAKMLTHAGWELLLIPPDKNGFITTEAVLETIRPDTALVAVMAVNNETGAIQNVQHIAEALKTASAGKRKPHFHVDAVQAFGKVPLTLKGTAIDSAACSAHKLGGPRGIGLLYMERRVEPFIRGGAQEEGLRPGTVNVAGALALSVALEKNIRAKLHTEYGRTLMEKLLSGLSSIPTVALIPEDRKICDDRFSPWIVQATNSKVPGEVLVRMLSDRGIFISTGSACSSRKNSRPVLEAMRLSADKIQKAFRISIGPETTLAEIATVIEVLTASLA